MIFYSTNLKAKEANIREVILNGLAEDKGLYMPKSFPVFTKEELDSLKEMDYREIAFMVMKKFLHGFIEDKALEKICRDSYNFPIPLEKLDETKYIMRLDKGPTAAFKDFAARAMARIMQQFTEEDKKELLILTATSGDTGSAVANAFHNLDNIEVVILFPEKEVTERQRKLMTTLGGNITAISVNGKFDDCQALVKDAFVDKELNSLNLSSANSINFARLMPQIVYYVYAYSRLGKVNFSVPSGNFGDLMGGLIAKKMGLPVDKFIVAVNENDEFMKFYKTSIYEKISPSRNCLSNAMNVGHPSNFARLAALYNGIIDDNGIFSKMPDMEAIRKDMWAYSVTDEQTKEEIKSVYERYHTLIEPHGAVGLYAYERYLEETKDNTITVCFETADPAKFPETIREVLNIEPKLPDSMKLALEKEEKIGKIPNDYKIFKEFLLTNFSR
ncbi:MAG: threonine synthase [Nanoarchaeota archaeon]|nr:threonine synthase [Nanoarchaeota archaeon]